LEYRYALERNLHIYEWYLPLSRVYFFTPIYFLFFSSRFSIGQVLVLGSIYYFTVVLVELPSGYLSDRLGRAVALRLSAASLSVSYVLFLVGGESFPTFVVAQIALGVGYASISGTDTALHFDTLVRLGREAEFAEREQRLIRNGYAAGALGALLAGAVAQQELEYAYALGLAAALGLLALAFVMREPRSARADFSGRGLLGQFVDCTRTLRDRELAWLFAYAVVMVSLAHIPSEFAQPYLAAVLGDDIRDVQRTPWVAGVVVASNTLLAAFAAAYSLALRERLGARGALLAAAVVQLGLIGAMAQGILAIVAVLLVLRSCQSAIARVILSAEVTPRLDVSLRASFLSLESLAGRLGYGLLLLWLSGLAGPDSVGDAAVILDMLRACAGVAAVGLLGLIVTRRAMKGSSDVPSA
jgi:MFS family permease